MTILEVINSDKEFLIPTDVAPIIGCDPHSIRVMARQRPELLGFKVTVVGNKTKIPRIPFLEYLGRK